MGNHRCRFDVARDAKVVATIDQSQPDFVAGDPAARLHYRLLYRILGFRVVETLADWKRTLSSP